MCLRFIIYVIENNKLQPNTVTLEILQPISHRHHGNLKRQEKFAPKLFQSRKSNSTRVPTDPGMTRVSIQSPTMFIGLKKGHFKAETRYYSDIG